MTFHCLIYTTSDPRLIQPDLPFIQETLLRTPGRDAVVFTVKKHKAPKSITTFTDQDGDVKPDWLWFYHRFVVGLDPKYNAVCFHFTPTERRKWKLSTNVNGSAHRTTGPAQKFWVCARPKKKAEHYPFSEFTRIMLHEIAHGDVLLTGDREDLVHAYDYKLHRIHHLFAELSYKDWNILAQIKQTLINFLKGAWKTN